MLEYDVVIIDSGLNSNNDLAVSGVCIEKINNTFCINNIFTDEVGHGTIIYSVINKLVDSTKIYIVKLNEFNRDLDDSYLIAALEFVKNNIKCKIINMSLGVTYGDNIDKLYSICNEISSMGIVIVSAFDNAGCYSYPAAFDCVIGVDNKNNINLPTEFDYVENSPINVLGKGSLQRLKMEDEKILLVGGSSIACAHISSILANTIDSNWGYQQVLSHLKSIAKHVYPSHNLKNLSNNNFFKITNAAVFPFSKETQAFLRFRDMLSFNICGFYDIRRSGKVGRKLKSYYEQAECEAKIMDVESIDYTNIDTIIIGHLDELNSILGRDYKIEMIKKAIENNVNIYSFDPLDSYTHLLDCANIEYYYPKVTENDVPENTFGKLYKISKPVVGIFGTSSQQGKFSLQLALKKELESLNYDVGTIGTEPHSLLFNFDCVFPMGYNSTVRLSNHEIVLYLNNVINNLCQKEIILASTQAQFVPYCCNNLLEVPSMQYHFALGIRPDAILLCINYHDEVEYIRNTIYALMGLTDATILALVIYPLTYANDWNEIYGNVKYKITNDEFKKKARELQKIFQIPVFLLGNSEHTSELCKTVIDFFDD